MIKRDGTYVFRTEGIRVPSLKTESVVIDDFYAENWGLRRS
jgi:hypothetical protein